jgi:hypothetical protein
MIMHNNTKTKWLRFFLLIAGLGWGSTIIGVFLPWDFAIEHLQKFGGSGPIPDDPMLNYWLRMAAGAFAIIGFLFCLCAWKPNEYKNIIPILALLNILEGLLLLYYGLILQIGWFPFVVDVAIGLVPGIGILLFYKELKKNA